MIILETSRLIIRNVNVNDAKRMYEYRNNENCSKYQRDQTKEMHALRELLDFHQYDKINLEHPFLFAIELKEINEMIGEIVVMPKEKTFSIGYTISYKFHRRGFAYEALNDLINYLHLNYPEWEFISFTHPENIASMKLLTKLGYQNLGYSSSINSQAFGKWVKESTLEEFNRNI